MRLPTSRITAVSMCLVLATSASAQAPDPRQVQPERPTVATHAHTVAPGFLEIETGVQGDDDPGARLWTSPTVFKLGLTQHMQLNIGVPYHYNLPLRAGSGVGDVTLGLKWRLLDDSYPLGDFAILPFVKLNNARRLDGLGTGDRDIGITLISSHDIREVAIDLNLTYTAQAVGTNSSAASAQWTASFGAPVVGRLSWVAEFFGSPSIDASNSPPTVSFLTGPTYSLATELTIDAGIITPVHGDTPSALYAGLVWNVGRLFGSAGSAPLAGVAPRRFGSR